MLKNNPFSYHSNLLFSVIFAFSLSSCAHKHFDGSNNFESLIAKMVDTSYTKLQKELAQDDVILVSDFVNIDNLKNRSKLGFLLSEVLKNELSKKDIIIKEVELSQHFTIGKSGFNVLSRNIKNIYPVIKEERFAMVGTYSITYKRLILFVKLINIRTGHILSSSTQSVLIDKEISKLDFVEEEKKEPLQVFQPLLRL